MSSTTEERPDVTEMTAVHFVFRDTFSAAPKLIEAIDPNDGDRIELIKNFYANILAFLSVHHGSEDELLYPWLLERAAADQRDTISRVNAQHHEVEDVITVASGALDAWSAGDAAAQERAAAKLAHLGERLSTHLDDEEQLNLPICSELVSAAEWGMLPGHTLASFRGDKVWLILGLIRERFSQEQRDAMDQKMPPPAVEMWTGFGEKAFGELITQVGPPLG